MAKKKRTRTPEQREAWNAYMRRYRRDNPERVKAWRDAYMQRKITAEAAKLAALAADGDNGVEGGGSGGGN